MRDKNRGMSRMRVISRGEVGGQVVELDVFWPQVDELGGIIAYLVTPNVIHSDLGVFIKCSRGWDVYITVGM